MSRSRTSGRAKPPFVSSASSFRMMSRVCDAGIAGGRVSLGEQPGDEQDVAGLDRRTEVRALLRVGVDRLARRRRRDKRHLDFVGRAREAGAHRRPRRTIGADDLAVDAVELREVLEVGKEDARAHEVREAQAGRFEQFLRVVEDGARLRRHVARDDGVVLAVARNQPGEKQRLPRADPVRIRIGRRHPRRGMDRAAIGAAGHGDGRSSRRARPRCWGSTTTVVRVGGAA